MLPSRPILVRSRKVLNDQFSYHYGITDDGDAGAYLARFRVAFALLIFVGATGEALKEFTREDNDDRSAVRPLVHP